MLVANLLIKLVEQSECPALEMSIKGMTVVTCPKNNMDTQNDGFGKRWTPLKYGIYGIYVRFLGCHLSLKTALFLGFGVALGGVGVIILKSYEFSGDGPRGPSMHHMDPIHGSHPASGPFL